MNECMDESRVNEMNGALSLGTAAGGSRAGQVAGGSRQRSGGSHRPALCHSCGDGWRSGGASAGGRDFGS